MKTIVEVPPSIHRVRVIIDPDEMTIGTEILDIREGEFAVNALPHVRIWSEP